VGGGGLKVPTDLYKEGKKNMDHPGNAPLITDLTFRSICNHVIDGETEWFDPDKVQQGDTIYLNLWYLRWFHKEVHDRIKYPYILVTCDVGAWFPDPYYQKLIYDPKLAAWFCRNSIFSSHPKIFQIPMGQSDRCFGYLWLPVLEEMRKQQPFERKYLLYMNHFPREYGNRINIIKLFEKEPYCLSRNHSDEPYVQISKVNFYKELANSTFVISPFGLETDCVRTWEALSLGCIPIVEHTFLDPLFEDMPVLFVHDWREINECFLKEKYEELKDKRRDKACFDGWRDLIKGVQEKIRHNDLTSSQLEATKWSPQQVQDFIEILEEEENPVLIYKGFLSTVHSLQIADAAPFLNQIYLCDPWLYPVTHDGWIVDIKFDDLKNYLQDPSLFRSRDKIALVADDEFLRNFINYNPLAFHEAPIFLDLGYYRNSLLSDFQNIRHSLLKDLDGLVQQMRPGALLFGNGTNHSYVREVLEQLSKKHQMEIGRKGSFWFLRSK